MTEIVAHPTMYRGTRFRSRLEARWAAFFDRARWPWEYEPVDLPGWVPDFALLPDPTLLPDVTREPAYVEVKPVLEYARFVSHHRRIEGAAPAYPVLLVGAATPFAGPALGQAYHAGAWSGAVLGWCRGACDGRLTVVDDWTTIECFCLFCRHRLTDHERNAVEATSRAARLWAEAGNDTRWRG